MRSRRFTRLAAAQLDYHPAAVYDRRSLIEDPLAGLEDALAVPTELFGERRALRERVRSAYLRSLRPKVLEIVRACAGWEVDLLVFPEYSIPWELLEPIAGLALNITVVAGTHSVERAGLVEGVYSRLGLPAGQAPRAGSAVAPVLRAGRLLGIVGKMSPSRVEEAGQSFIASEEWRPVQCPEESGISNLGVLICLDFLHRNHDSQRERVVGAIDSVELFAVPSLTPWHSVDDFASRAKEEARRYKRPVVYANASSHGGTTIYADDDPATPRRDFPGDTLILGRGEEGVVVADVDLGTISPGSSTAYDHVRPVRPFAAASLVYSSTALEKEYSEWSAEFSSRLNRGMALEEALKAIDDARDLLLRVQADRPGVLRTRLSLLLDRLDYIASVEELRQFTRDVMLPATVLPHAWVRRGLAHGTKQVVASWRRMHDRGLEDVERRLGAAARLDAPGADATQVAQEALWALSEEVRGQHRGDEAAASDDEGRAAVGIFVEHLMVDNKDVEVDLEAANFHGAEEKLQRLMADAAAVLRVSPTASLVLEMNKMKVRRARLLLNQQRPDEAVGILKEVEPSGFAPPDRARLAVAWAVAGRPDEARRILASLPPEYVAREMTVVEARISIAEEKLPATLPRDPAVMSAAAWLQSRRGLLPDALRLARDAVELSRDSFDVLGPYVLLVQLLYASVWEDDWVLVPVPTGERADVISTIERLRREHAPAWLSMTRPPNAKELRTVLESADEAYREATYDIDAWEAADASGREVAANLRAAVQLAESGDVEGAQALWSSSHPWWDELRRVRLLVAAGRIAEARNAIQILAAHFPDRGPIEYFAAGLCQEAGELHNAVQYARRAFEQVPGGGYRLLLVHCLNELGKLEEAWRLVEPVWQCAGPTLVRAAAHLADRIRQQLAPDIWARFLELRPQDAAARLSRARALFGRRERDQAAAEAWDAFIVARGKMEPWMLGLVARLQFKPPEPPAESLRRIEEIREELRSRFPDDVSSLQIRADLARLTGAEIDVEQMVEAGAAYAIPLTELPGWLNQRSQADVAAWRLYADGGVSLAGLSRARAEPFATTFLALWSNTKRHFCAPVLERGAPTENLSRSGAFDEIELVVGPTELMLLAHLQLLKRLADLAERRRWTVLLPEPYAVELRLQNTRFQTSPEHDSAAARLTQRVCDCLDTSWLSTRTWAELHEGTRTEVPELPTLRTEYEQASDLLRGPLEERLSQAAAIMARPAARRMLTCDHYATAGIGNIELGHAFRWDSAANFGRVIRLLRRAATAYTTIPEIVRLLADETILPADVAEAVLRELAAQGFRDALGGRQLAELGREGLSAHLAVLSGLEAMARVGGTSAGPVGMLSVSQTYADAIVVGALGAQGVDWPFDPATGLRISTERGGALSDGSLVIFLSTLLGRLEELDSTEGVALEVALSFVALQAVGRVVDAVTPAPNDSTRMNLDDKSPVGQLWERLRDWAGSDGRRRTALDRAVSSAWILLDHVDRDPNPARIGPLLLAQTGRRTERELPFDREILAILSANWTERPLAKVGMVLTVQRRSENTEREQETHVDLLWEDLLVRAAAADELTVIDGGRSVRATIELKGLRLPFSFVVPAEAVVLRMSADRFQYGVEHLTQTQGLHDGISHRHLQHLSREPTDLGRRRAYAQYSAAALWRRVRDDPGYLPRWVHRVDLTGEGAPRLATLLEMLHEPPEPIAANSAGELFRARMEGPWASLDETLRSWLVLQSSLLPGILRLYAAPASDDEEGLREAIELAVARLEAADEYAVGLLAHDIRILSVVAAEGPHVVQLKRGVVDLRSLLPDLLVRVIDLVEHPKKAIGLHETELLRVSARVVAHLLRYEPGRSARDYLWLTYRLHGWTTEQLLHIEPVEREDGVRRLIQAAAPEFTAEAPSESEIPELFDPFAFRAHGFSFRPAVVLAALISGVGLARSRGRANDMTVSSPALERLIQRLAEGEDEPHSFAGKSWIDWPFPTSVADLAAYWLLSVNPQRFFSGDTNRLIRRIESLPNAISGLSTGDRDLALMLARGLAFSLQSLSDSVAVAYRQSLERLIDEPDSRRIWWMGSTSLLARGDATVARRARDAVAEFLADESAPVFIAFYLSGVVTTLRRELAVEVDELLNTDAADASRGHVLLGLARLVLHGGAEAASQARPVLLEVAQRAEFAGDPGVRQLIETLTTAGAI